MHVRPGQYTNVMQGDVILKLLEKCQDKIPGTEALRRVMKLAQLRSIGHFDERGLHSKIF